MPESIGDGSDEPELTESLGFSCTGDSFKGSAVKRLLDQGCVSENLRGHKFSWTSHKETLALTYGAVLQFKAAL